MPETDARGIAISCPALHFKSNRSEATGDGGALNSPYSTETPDEDVDVALDPCYYGYEGCACGSGCVVSSFASAQRAVLASPPSARPADGIVGPSLPTPAYPSLPSTYAATRAR
jgi:hypothetical protein